MSRRVSYRAADGEKFNWKFSKKLFWRPLERDSLVALLRKHESDYRGTLLAILTIGLISGIIVLAALSVTYTEIDIQYERYTISELLFFSENQTLAFTKWAGDVFIYETPEGRLQGLDFSTSQNPTLYPIDVDISAFKPFHSISQNTRKDAWLIKYDKTQVGLQEVAFRFTVVHKNSLQTMKHFLHTAFWGARDYEILVQMDNHVYHTDNFFQTGFRCVTCHLKEDVMHGYPGWIHQKYFSMDQDKAIQISPDPASDRILVFYSDERHLKTTPFPVYGLPPEQYADEAIVYSTAGQIPAVPSVPITGVEVIQLFDLTAANLTYKTIVNLVRGGSNSTADIGTTKGIYVTGLWWFNTSSFIVQGVEEFQKCGFILFCSVNNFPKPLWIACFKVWQQCTTSGWLDLRSSKEDIGIVKESDQSFVMKLPYKLEGVMINQLGVLKIHPERKNDFSWLTEPPIEVSVLLHGNPNGIFFVGSHTPGSQHVFRLNRPDAGLFCLTCNQSADDDHQTHASTRSLQPVNLRQPIRVFWNDTHYQVEKVRSSAGGRCISARWRTGYESFGARGRREVSNLMLVNMLTGRVKNVTKVDSGTVIEGRWNLVELDNREVVWCLGESRVDGKTVSITVQLMWHSLQHLAGMQTLSHKEFQKGREKSNTLYRSIRSGEPHRDTEKAVPHQPVQKVTSKQHPVPPSPAVSKLLRGKSNFIDLGQPRLYLPYPERVSKPMPNVVRRFITFTLRKAPEKRRETLFSSLRRDDSPQVGEFLPNQGFIVDGAAVTIWLPPLLTESHVKTYGMIVVFCSDRDNQLPTDLATYLSATFDLVVLHVEEWVGKAAHLAKTESLDGLLRNYRNLLTAINTDYHYIDKTRVGFVGVGGVDSNLAGVLSASLRLENSVNCVALLSPIVNWLNHERVEGIRFLGPYRGNEDKYSMFNLIRLLGQYTGLHFLIAYAQMDTMSPLAHAMHLIKALAGQNMDVTLMPLFYSDGSFVNTAEKAALMRKIAFFFIDCFNRTLSRDKKCFERPGDSLLSHQSAVSFC